MLDWLADFVPLDSTVTKMEDAVSVVGNGGVVSYEHDRIPLLSESFKKRHNVLRGSRVQVSRRLIR